MVVFRSVLVPLKAAIMNLLSIGAAYGVIVAVFQWGWAKDLVGLDATVPVNPFVPMIMFAILFGLSMDYEVFLLSRVREEFQRTGDSHRSVVDGLASTARVITSAALIMISVFLAFVTSDNVTVKMFGLGLATAVLIDATLVRMVLVPSTMSLLGGANWWLPRWLDRILPHMDLEGYETEDAATADRGAAGGRGGAASRLTGFPNPLRPGTRPRWAGSLPRPEVALGARAGVARFRELFAQTCEIRTWVQRVRDGRRPGPLLCRWARAAHFADRATLCLACCPLRPPPSLCAGHQRFESDPQARLAMVRPWKPPIAPLWSRCPTHAPPTWSWSGRRPPTWPWPGRRACRPCPASC